MGRKIPTGANPLLIHPAISLPLLAAWIMATIAIITGLCVAKSRKKSSPPPSPASLNKTPEKSEIATSSPASMEAITLMIPPSQSPSNTATTTLDLDDTTEKLQPQQVQEPLKLPPMRHLSESSSYSYKPKTAPKRSRRLSMSLSMNISRSMSIGKHHQSTKEEGQQKKKDKLKAEDSIWMKTIILGERCRVPNEDDAIIYDGKGNRISTYHPKTPRSVPVSRTNSFIDPAALPS